MRDMIKCNPKDWLSGLRSTLLFVSLLVFFQVWSQSIPSFTVSAVACTGQEVSFTNTSVVLNGDTLSYNWIFEDQNLGFSNTENPTYVWREVGEYQVQLIIENQHGDTSSISKSVKVNPTPRSGFSTKYLCKGIPAKFEGDHYDVNIYGGVSYEWSFPDTSITQRIGQYTFNEIGVYSVSLKVTSIVGCADSLESSLDVKEPVLLDFKVEDACMGDTSVFTNLTNDPSKEYRWNYGDRNTSADYHGKHLYAQANIYNVRLEVLETDNTCASDIVKQAIVNPLPDASFTYEVISSYRRIVQFYGPADNDFYRWSFGDGAKSTDQNPLYEYEKFDGSNFTVCLATRFGQCWSEECEELVSFVSVEDFESSNGHSVYPNPSIGLFNVTIPINEIIEYGIYDVSGRKLDLAGVFDREKLVIDMTRYPKGVYYLQLNSSSDRYTTKLVVK